MSISVKNSRSIKGHKQTWIEVIRIFATLAVVFLHVAITLVANYTPKELGVFNYAVFNDCYILVTWSVPNFIMISGALLLDPKKNINWEKIGKYIIRMFLVLLTFGVAYALMELIFLDKSFSLIMIAKAVLNTAEGKSWSHLWYIYMLIGLYLLTMPIRYVIQMSSEKEIELYIIIMLIGNFIIPTINTVFGRNLANYMLTSEYLTYYIAGYYLSTTKRRFGKWVVIPMIVSVIIMIVTENVSLFDFGRSYALNHQTKNILVFLLSTSVFISVKNVCESRNVKIGRFSKLFSSCSFAIYLIHPFFINLIYKVFRITPLSFPIGIGVIVMFLIVLASSLVAAIIVKWIPLIKNIV